MAQKRERLSENAKTLLDSFPSRPVSFTMEQLHERSDLSPFQTEKASAELEEEGFIKQRPGDSWVLTTAGFMLKE